jgi:hypothetical protein
MREFVSWPLCRLLICSWKKAQHRGSSLDLEHWNHHSRWGEANNVLTLNDTAPWTKAIFMYTSLARASHMPCLNSTLEDESSSMTFPQGKKGSKPCSLPQGVSGPKPIHAASL